MARTELVFRPVVDLADALGGTDVEAAFGFGLDGSVHAAASLTDEPRYDEVERSFRYPDGERTHTVRFRKTLLDEPAPLRLVSWHDGDLRTVTVPEEDAVVDFVQPHPEGLLLVGARCHAGPPPDENALLVDRDGRVLRRLVLGDGIADVRVTSSGDAWVAYRDEGVFGNYGWGGPSGEPSPVGSRGLVRFDAHGRVVERYDRRVAGTKGIHDVYAADLTADGAVWVYFYTEFPVVRLRDGAYRAWSTGLAREDDVRGARALAVRGDRALLLGSYDRQDTAAELRLGDAPVAERVAAYDLVDDAGAPWTDRCVGVGDRVYGVRGRTVWRAAW